ncbi:DUF1254 domain-containing protein [Novosphingobium mathurense]|uniref:Uncharacterized conserved protein n=1 Tax=Novosphingobium mathurense TaxID=428990 RepID=A0A1U6ILF8_9SPHN|nr:DUF1214 domain-containing protein [Novosphingobium mathurense]SLK08844.1 Uncharacterized conserved protein [Novosphingobium mathurense]
MKGPVLHAMSAALLAAGLAPGAYAKESGCAKSAETAPEALAQTAEELYIWGYPLVQAARIRLVSTQGSVADSAKLTAPIHHFAHGRVLANPSTHIGVGPNNDTLYSLIWMDLKKGPFVFEAPDFGERYYTFSLNAADSTSSDSLGQRTHGGKLPPLFIHGPDFAGSTPAGMVDVTSPTRYFELAGRTLTTGTDADYAKVHALQNAMKLRTYADWRHGVNRAPTTAPQRPLHDGAHNIPPDLMFLEELGQVLRDWWAQPDDVGYLNDAKKLGIDPDGFNPGRLNGEERARIAEGLVQGQKLVECQSRRLGVQSHGWTTNYQGARFGQDYLLRAAVAKDQIYVAVPEEAIYPIGRVDSEGQLLNGNFDYRIRMSADSLPPVGAFWSITLYDDNGFMVENPIDRYSIGDRTQDLMHTQDGSVEIAIGHTRPSGADLNWLPAPQGPFYLMMRLYVPGKAILDGTWTPPPIVRVSSAGD